MSHWTKIHHADLSLFLRGEELHNRRLNQGYQGHVGIRCHGYGTQKVGRQLGRQINRSGAVSAADDSDGCRFLHIEAQNHGTCQGHENADLGSSAEKHGFRVGNEGRKVRHSSHTHENQWRENFILNTKSNSHHDAHFRFKTGVGEIGHNVAKSNGHEQQRLIFLGNGQVQEHQAHQNHNDIFNRKRSKSRICPHRSKGSHKTIHNVYLLTLIVIFLFLLVLRGIHDVNQLDHKRQENEDCKYDNHVSETNGEGAWRCHRVNRLS